MCVCYEEIRTPTVFAYFYKKKLRRDKPEMNEKWFLRGMGRKKGKWRGNKRKTLLNRSS